MSTSYQSGKAWRMTLLLGLYMIINFSDKVAVGMLAVPMMTELKLSPAMFGLLGSSYFWLFAVAGVVGGFVTNRVATTGMLLAMAVAWAVLQIPMALSSSLVVLVAARVLLGVAEGPAWPIAVHALHKWFPDAKRDLPVACIAQGASFGLLAAGVALPLITLRWGWRANFYVLAALGIAWSLLWLAFGREGQEAGAGQAVRVATVRVRYGRLLREPTVAACIAMRFAMYWALALVLTWMPAYIQRGLGFDGVTSGRLLAVNIGFNVLLSVAGIVVVRRMLARGASSRNARGRFSAVAMVLAGAALVCLYLSAYGPVWRVLTIGFALGVAQVIYAAGPAILAEVVPPSQRSAILAIDSSISSVGGILAPLLMGLIVTRMPGPAGYEAGFALSGVLMLGAAAFGFVAIDPDKAARNVRQGAEAVDAQAAPARSSLAG
ncbi:MFS transporter [Burkholderia guangdongensis]|uniref:MFS transporter n=1 Tax=Burkholderia guangdongensis TaxID=1792500 RepID=UPI0015C8D73E|nr:MFS transporter [Burkholderia guangdongensis]